MVNIVRPEGGVQSLGNANISGNVAAEAGRGTIATGQQLQQVADITERAGQEQFQASQRLSAIVDQQGAELFEKSKKASQSATMLNKMTQATEKFLLAQQERYKVNLDKEGNPTFQNLHTDIGNIGQDILKGVRDSIIDPEVQQMFSLQFGEYVSNQKISALQKGIAAQNRHAKKSLKDGLDMLMMQSAADTADQMGTYESTGLGAIQNALAGGVITKPEFDAQSHDFSQSIRVNSIESLIRDDAQGAASMLSKPASELGINEDVRGELASKLASKVTSDDYEMSKAKEIAKIDNLAEEASIVHRLEAKIDAGLLRPDELIAFNGKLRKNRLVALKKRFIKVSEGKEKERAIINEIGNRVVEGTGVDDISASNLNLFYNYAIKLRADITGKPVSLAESAEIAAMIPAPNVKFANKLEAVAKHGDTKQAADMLSAYTYIKDRGARTLESSFNEESTLLMEHSLLLVEKGGMAAPEALLQSRELILKVNKEQRADNLIAFQAATAEGKSFSPENLEETAASNLPDAESWYGKNMIDEDAKNDFKTFVKDGYMKTGDKDSAISYAVEMMSRRYGVSEVSGSKEYMFNPPEKMFPDISPKDLRNILIHDVTPALPAGIKPKSIGLKANKMGKGWIPTYKKKIGDREIEVPLLNEHTGKPRKWTPKGSDYYQVKQQQSVDAAKAANEKFRNTPSNARLAESIVDLNIQ